MAKRRERKPVLKLDDRTNPEGQDLFCDINAIMPLILK
jgi:hypothetical protein